MPYKEHYVEKVRFTIGEAAEILGHFFGGKKVATSAIRFWEMEFDPFLKPMRKRKRAYSTDGKLYFEVKERSYKHEDIDKLITVAKLLYVEGYTIYGAKRQLVLNAKDYGLLRAPKFKKFILENHD